MPLKRGPSRGAGRTEYPPPRQNHRRIAQHRPGFRNRLYNTPSSYQAELQSRLKVAIEALTAETVASRESSERLTGELGASIKALTAEIVAFRQSSESADRRLSRLTVVLIVLTVVLAA
jgi:hypothetical protein